MFLEVYSSQRKVQTIKNEWETLQERDIFSTPFQSFGWCMAYFESFCKSSLPKNLVKFLRILAVRDEQNRLLALMPGYLVFKGRPWYQPLGFGFSDYCQPLFGTGDSRQAFQLILSKARLHGFARVHIPNIPESHPVLGMVSNIYRENTDSLVKFLPEAEEKVIGLVSSKLRNQLKKYISCCQDFNIQVVHGSDPQFSGAVDDLARLHKSRWEAKGKTGLLGYKMVNMLKQCARYDRFDFFRMVVIKNKAEVIGANLCFKWLDKYYYYQSGFNMEYEDFGLGNVMVFQHMTNAVREKCRSFDFLRGTEPYKERWRPDFRIKHFGIKI